MGYTRGVTPFAQAKACIDGANAAELSRVLTADPDLAKPPKAPASVDNCLLLHLCNWPGGKERGAELAEVLIDHGSDPNQRAGNTGESALHFAASNPHDRAIIDVLIKAGADVNISGGIIRGGTPLMNALFFGFLHVGTRLMEHGASIHNMLLAAALGRIDLLKQWHGGKLSFNAEAGRVHPSNEPSAELLTETEVESWTFNAMKAALVCQQWEAADWLIDAGFDINHTPDNEGWSCLHHAAYRGSLPMAMFLVERGVQLELRTQEHNVTAADYASAHGHPEVMNYLIDAGTPLDAMNAAHKGRLDLVMKLDGQQPWAQLLKGTIGVRTDIGKPLAPALRRARIAVARYLVQKHPGLIEQEFDGASVKQHADDSDDPNWLAEVSAP